MLTFGSLKWSDLFIEPTETKAEHWLGLFLSLTHYFPCLMKLTDALQPSKTAMVTLGKLTRKSHESMSKHPNQLLSSDPPLRRSRKYTGYVLLLRAMPKVRELIEEPNSVEELYAFLPKVCQYCGHYSSLILFTASTRCEGRPPRRYSTGSRRAAPMAQRRLFSYSLLFS